MAKNIDDILGKITLKNLLQHLKSGAKEETTVKNLVDSVMEVPAHINLRNLLTEMQRRGENFAVVFDEYGGTIGIATTEDIIEEIVGDIKDESDTRVDEIIKTEDKTFIVDAGILLRDLEREIGFPQGIPFSALQGYLTKLFGRIPESGDTVSDSNFKFTIQSIDKPRIGKVIIERLTHPHIAPKSEKERNRK